MVFYVWKENFFKIIYIFIHAYYFPMMILMMNIKIDKYATKNKIKDQ